MFPQRYDAIKAVLVAIEAAFVPMTLSPSGSVSTFDLCALSLFWVSLIEVFSLSVVLLYDSLSLSLSLLYLLSLIISASLPVSLHLCVPVTRPPH